MTDLNANTNDLDLEYKDVVKDPNDPQMRQIAETIPEKYKDKTRDDLVDMHVNIEKVLTRQGNELGQLRKLVDSQNEIINRVTAHSTQAEPVKKMELTPETLLNDPVNSVNKVVEENPAVKSGNERITQLELQIQEQRFAQSHPTYRQDVQDPAFQSWVLASPVRTKLLGSLDKYNFNAGQELWELWGEHQAARQASETTRQTHISTISVTKPAGGEPVGKPIYSRIKLMELHTKAINGDAHAKAKWEDPEFQREYQLAHLEKRVR